MISPEHTGAGFGLCCKSFAYTAPDGGLVLTLTIRAPYEVLESLSTSTCRESLGLYRDNGKENGSYDSILRLYRDVGIMDKKMETTIRDLGSWHTRVKNSS